MNPDQYQKIRTDRGEIYGDPLINHQGISATWQGLLQPHWRDIREGKSLPPWVIALCMVGLKLNRMRLKFWEDNYEDLEVYMSFAKKWQEEWQKEKDSLPPQKERIYVAGPYTATSHEEILYNTKRAEDIGLELIKKGHDVYIPHKANFGWEAKGVGYETLMDIGGSFLDSWATSLFFISSSPGTDREVERAEWLNLKIYKTLEEVPLYTEIKK